MKSQSVAASCEHSIGQASGYSPTLICEQEGALSKPRSIIEERLTRIRKALDSIQHPRNQTAEGESEELKWSDWKDWDNWNNWENSWNMVDARAYLKKFPRRIPTTL